MADLVDGLVHGLPAEVRDQLVQRAEGIPTYAVETVRALIDRDLVVPRGGAVRAGGSATTWTWTRSVPRLRCRR